MANFNKDVESHVTTNYTATLPLAGNIWLYRSTLEEIHDKHTPLKTKKVSDRVNIPWFNDDVAAAIHDRRKAEWRWYAQGSDTMRFLEFYRLWRKVSNLLDDVERKYYHTQLQDNTHNFKKIFRICNGILGRRSTPATRTHWWRTSRKI